MVYSTGRFVLALPCVILFLYFFFLFSIAITSSGDERVKLSALLTFLRFALAWFCLFPPPFRVMIVTFSYPFFPPKNNIVCFNRLS